MGSIKNWNGRDVPVRRSRTSGVIAFEHWEDNVIRGDARPWPPPDLDRQVRSYTANPSHFSEEDATALATPIGVISKFQSINSEDALTWNWFGTLMHAQASARRDVLAWLLERIRVPGMPEGPAISLWGRVFHPNAAGGRNGPELDARIDDPAALIYVEAKWKADLGTGRGSTEGTLDDQVVLRRDSLRKDPALKGDERPFVVLCVSQTMRDLAVYEEDEKTRLRSVHIRWLTWEELATCPAHPQAGEFDRYLEWKRQA